MITSVKPRLLAIAIATLAWLIGGPIASDPAVAAPSGGVDTVAASGAGTDDASEPVNAKYDRLWNRVVPADKRWAHETSECESGGDPNAIGAGGIYRGAFQFMRSTWKGSPKSPGGDPIAYPYRTQAVVAVMLKNRDGANHWPVCG